MFEELNQHRAAVAENIQKACEIGFTGNELEKAHKVGDIHPNGKWVWTQLPSGRYDWRVIKKTIAGSGSAAPAAAQKTAQSGNVQLPGIGKELVYESKKEPGKLIKVVGLEPDVFAFKKMTNGAWVKIGESKTENAKKLLEDYALKKEVSTGNKSEEGKKPKVSAFVTKTMDEIKKTVGWRNYTEQKLSSIAKKIQENEELAKKVMSGKFPTASWSALNPNEESVKIGNDELIFSAYKSVHSSRYAPHNGQMDYHYSVKVKRSGSSDAKEIARGSYSSGRYGGTAAEAKKECKIDALLRLINE